MRKEYKIGPWRKIKIQVSGEEETVFQALLTGKAGRRTVWLFLINYQTSLSRVEGCYRTCWVVRPTCKRHRTQGYYWTSLLQAARSHWGFRHGIQICATKVTCIDLAVMFARTYFHITQNVPLHTHTCTCTQLQFTKEQLFGNNKDLHWSCFTLWLSNSSVHGESAAQLTLTGKVLDVTNCLSASRPFF